MMAKIGWRIWRCSSEMMYRSGVPAKIQTCLMQSVVPTREQHTQVTASGRC